MSAPAPKGRTSGRSRDLQLALVWTRLHPCPAQETRPTGGQAELHGEARARSPDPEQILPQRIPGPTTIDVGAPWGPSRTRPSPWPIQPWETPTEAVTRAEGAAAAGGSRLRNANTRVLKPTHKHNASYQSVLRIDVGQGCRSGSTTTAPSGGTWDIVPDQPCGPSRIWTSEVTKQICRNTAYARSTRAGRPAAGPRRPPAHTVTNAFDHRRWSRSLARTVTSRRSRRPAGVITSSQHVGPQRHHPVAQRRTAGSSTSRWRGSARRRRFLENSAMPAQPLTPQVAPPGHHLGGHPALRVERSSGPRGS